MSVEQADLAAAPPRTAASAMEPDSAVVDREASALRFVQPFTFDGRTFAERAAAVEGSVWTGRRPLSVWRQQQFPTTDLLAHVAEFLQPTDGTPRAAALWRMDEDALRSPAGLGGGRAHGGAAWTLHTPHSDIAFALHGVELALFRHGVGFLAVRAQPLSDSPRDWFDFIHHFRFAAGERAPSLRAERRVQPDGDGHAAAAAYFPPVAGAAAAPGAARYLGEILGGLLEQAASGEQPSRWWREIFVPGVLLPYPSVYIDGGDATDGARTLYRLRNFFHADQDARPGDQPGTAVMEYAERQWFFFSLNGGGFLARDAPADPFFRGTLPAHIERQYFLLFLLALQQRFVLMKLSQDVSRHWVSGATAAARATAFARIHDALLAFTAQGYFPQTMQEEHHHRYYEHWLRTFQITQLYEQVSAEVREMHTDLELRERERAGAAAERREARMKATERRFNRIGFLVGVPVWLFILVNSAVNVAVVRNAVAHAGPAGIQWYDMVLSLAVGVTGFGLGVLLYRVLSRSLRT